MNIRSLFGKRQRAYFDRRREEKAWASAGFVAPSPSHVKRTTLLRLGLPHATWVETGTFRGDTTALLLKHGSFVYSIEPDLELYQAAKRRFLDNDRVKILHGLSEEILPVLLPTIHGNVNFYLDGHYSGGITHQGPTDCPVLAELAAIASSMGNFKRVSLMIDDVRCFDPSKSGQQDYPSID